MIIMFKQLTHIKVAIFRELFISGNIYPHYYLVTVICSDFNGFNVLIILLSHYANP